MQEYFSKQNWPFQESITLSINLYFFFFQLQCPIDDFYHPNCFPHFNFFTFPCPQQLLHTQNTSKWSSILLFFCVLYDMISLTFLPWRIGKRQMHPPSEFRNFRAKWNPLGSLALKQLMLGGFINFLTPTSGWSLFFATL